MSTTAQIIPVTSDPNQTLQSTLNIDSGNIVNLTLNISFNLMAGYWVMQIVDISGNILLDSLPFLCGEYPAGNILGQFSYLAIGSMYVINATGIGLDSPSSTTLGNQFVLLADNTAST